MQDHLSQHTYASRPCCACAWTALTCVRTYFPFHRPRPAADDIFSEVLPTKMPMSGSSGIVPQMSPNTLRPHPNPFSRTYSPHGMPSHMSHVSRLCRISTRLHFSMVNGRAAAEQLLRPLALRASPCAVAAARARSIPGLSHGNLPGRRIEWEVVCTGSRYLCRSDPQHRCKYLDRWLTPLTHPNRSRIQHYNEMKAQGSSRTSGTGSCFSGHMPWLEPRGRGESGTDRGWQGQAAILR